MSDHESEQSPTLEPLLDKTTKTKIRLLSWCPSMDLLALVVAEDVLTIQRLRSTSAESASWQRICTVRAQAEITALTWRPDGKVVATGHKEGSVCLWDAVTGKSLVHSGFSLSPSLKFHEGPIVHLIWEKQHKSSRTEVGVGYGDRSKTFFHSSTTGDALRKNMDTANLSHWVDDVMPNFFNSEKVKPFSVLVSVDALGIMSFFAFGVLPLGTCKLPCGPKKVTVSRSLSEVLVLLNNDQEQELRVIDTSFISKCSWELGMVGWFNLNIIHCIHIFDLVVQEVANQSQKLNNVFNEYLSKLQTKSGEKTRDEDDFVVWLELLCFLASGIPTQRTFLLEEYIIHRLKKEGIVEWSKSTSTTINSLISLIQNHLQPLINSLLLIISDFSGYAKWESIFGKIGVKEDVVQTLLYMCQRSVIISEKILNSCVSANHSSNVFFTWLLAACSQLRDDPSRETTRGNKSQSNTHAYLNQPNLDTLIHALQPQQLRQIQLSNHSSKTNKANIIRNIQYISRLITNTMKQANTKKLTNLDSLRSEFVEVVGSIVQSCCSKLSSKITLLPNTYKVVSTNTSPRSQPTSPSQPSLALSKTTATPITNVNTVSAQKATVNGHVIAMYKEYQGQPAIWIISREDCHWSLASGFQVPPGVQVVGLQFFKSEHLLILSKDTASSDGVYALDLIPVHNLVNTLELDPERPFIDFISATGELITADKLSQRVTNMISQKKHLTENIMTPGVSSEKSPFEACDFHCSDRGLGSLLEIGRKHIVAYEFVDWDTDVTDTLEEED